jgi:endo-1,4-beta-xylanase
MNPFDTIQAETIDRQKGIKTDKCNEGGIMIKEITNGDWIRYTGIDFGNGADKFEIRAASNGVGGQVEIRVDGENGSVAGTCEIKSTGGWDKWNTFSCDVKGLKGVVKNIYLVFKGSNSTELFRLNWFKFSGATKTIVPTLANKENLQKNRISRVIFLNSNPIVENSILFELSGRKIVANNIKNSANKILILKREDLLR